MAFSRVAHGSQMGRTGPISKTSRNLAASFSGDRRNDRNGARLKLLVGGEFQIAPRQKHHRHRGIAQTLGNAHIGRIAAGGAAPHTETLVIHFYGNGISYFFVLLCVGNKHKGRFSLVFGNRRKCHDQKHLCNTNYNYYII